MRWHRGVSLGVVAAAAVLAAAVAGVGPALAGKPSGGGGGGSDSVDTGTIYFRHSGGTWTMNSDGSGKAALPSGVGGEPSHALHGGHRWFLYRASVSGQYEVFGIRDDGSGAVQLTSGAAVTIGSANCVRWSPDDAKVSWVASAGVYVASVTYDASGNVTGLASQPSSATVAKTALEAHDWAPDGARMVLGDTSWLLWTANVSTGATTRLTTSKPARDPQWSPDGSRIAFDAYEWNGGIWTVAPDGSGAKEIVREHAGQANYVGGAKWSPHGTHLVYGKSGSYLGDDRADAYRASATGSGPTNLTGDLDTRAMSGSLAGPLAWR